VRCRFFLPIASPPMRPAPVDLLRCFPQKSAPALGKKQKMLFFSRQCCISAASGQARFLHRQTIGIEHSPGKVILNSSASTMEWGLDDQKQKFTISIIL
jgi:hypothetical protein